jgi:hypothetical protein
LEFGRWLRAGDPRIGQGVMAQMQRCLVGRPRPVVDQVATQLAIDEQSTPVGPTQVVTVDPHAG